MSDQHGSLASIEIRFDPNDIEASFALALEHLRAADDDGWLSGFLEAATAFSKLRRAGSRQTMHLLNLLLRITGRRHPVLHDHGDQGSTHDVQHVSPDDDDDHQEADPADDGIASGDGDESVQLAPAAELARPAPADTPRRSALPGPGRPSGDPRPSSSVPSAPQEALGHVPLLDPARRVERSSAPSPVRPPVVSSLRARPGRDEQSAEVGHFDHSVSRRGTQLPPPVPPELPASGSLNARIPTTAAQHEARHLLTQEHRRSIFERNDATASRLNSTRTKISYIKGDLVLRRAPPRQAKDGTPWLPTVYTVVDMPTPSTARIKPSNKPRAKPILVATQDIAPTSLSPTQPSPDDDADLSYEFEEILDHRFQGNSLQLLIRWTGDPNPTWEPVENFSDCMQSVSKYLKQHLRRDALSSRVPKGTEPKKKGGMSRPRDRDAVT